MDLSSIHHIAIPVKDIDRAIKWYQSNFNCDVVHQDQSWALVRFANIYLAFVLPSQHPAHLAFVHSNIESLGTPKQHRDGTSSIYIKDSEGNTLEMLSPIGLDDLK